MDDKIELVGTKTCSQCLTTKEISLFYRNSESSDGYRANCKICQNNLNDLWRSKNREKIAKTRAVYRAKPEILRSRAQLAKIWNRKNMESVLLTHAKKRAKTLNIEFDITKEDVVIPEFCPVLGIRLEVGMGVHHDASPSIDRMDNVAGYVKNNISVISLKANRIKSNASFDEIKKIFTWMEKNVK